jgi:hypothetical protein
VCGRGGRRGGGVKPCEESNEDALWLMQFGDHYRMTSKPLFQGLFTTTDLVSFEFSAI